MGSSLCHSPAASIGDKIAIVFEVCCGKEEVEADAVCEYFIAKVCAQNNI